MWVCASKRGSQRLTLGIFLNHFPPSFWDRFCHWTLELANCLDWLPQAPGSSCLHIPNTGVTGGQHLEPDIKFSSMCQKHFGQLRYPLRKALNSMLWTTQSRVDSISLGLVNKQVGVWKAGDQRGSRTPWHRYSLLSILCPPTDCLVFCWLPLSSVQTPFHSSKSPSLPFLPAKPTKQAPVSPPWHLQ